MVRLGMAAASPERTSRRRSLLAGLSSARQLAAALARGCRPPGAGTVIVYVNRGKPNTKTALSNLATISRNSADQVTIIIITGLSTPIRAREPTPVLVYIALVILLGIICMASPARARGLGRTTARTMTMNTHGMNETFSGRAKSSFGTLATLGLATSRP